MRRAKPITMSAAAKRVLLIEDEPMLAEITAFRLELLGYEPVRAASAAEAFAAVEQSLPDLVLVDTQLGGSTGFEIAEHLKTDTRTAKIPIIALSSSADLDDVQRAFSSGAEEYLVVPFDPAVLEKKLEQVLASAGP